VISINNKHKMSKKLLLSPFNINLKMKYIKYRNLLTSLINKAKKLHYQALFKKYKSPIHKQGDKLLCNNYRPISLSLSLSKIYEKCIKYRIVSFLDKNSFFSNKQFGFLKGKCTSDAHFSLINMYTNILIKIIKY